MEIRTLPLSDLNPAPYNPRKDLQPDDPEYVKIARSIREFGLVEPLVWNERTGTLVGGHQRLKVLTDMGATETQVSVVHLDEAHERALNVALNRIMGEWDWARLTALLAPLAVEIRELAGFTIAEFEGLYPAAKAERDADAVPPVPTEVYVERGQVWKLGEHRLLCGDATVTEDVLRVLDGAKPSLMVTDPPYGVSYDASWRDRAYEAGAIAGAIAGRGRRTGKVTNDDRADWSEAWMLSPADVAYCWSPATADKCITHGQALEVGGFELRYLLVWSKPNSPISRGHYRPQFEPCWYAVRKGATASWQGGHDQSTVWEISLDKNVEGGHSTQKPVECMERPIRNHEGDVYEPFCGSGTTIIAAERQGRRCFAIEIEPAYVQVAIERWQAYTGGKAELVYAPAKAPRRRAAQAR